MIRSQKMVVGTYSRTSKKDKKRLMYLIIACIILSGIIYQIVGIYRNASRLGRVGTLIEVNDVNMHLYTNGTGDIPVVFTSDIGLTTPYVEMQPIHSVIAEKTSIAVYDKPGYGWSGLTGAPRDIDTITEEIHTLLNTAGQTKPFILVAHGMGSLEVLRYAQRYPEDVAGIVLIDGAAPSFCSEFNNIMIVESFLTNMSRNLGLLRLMSGTSSVQNMLNPNNDLPEDLKALNIGIGLEKTWNRNIIAEKLNVPDNAKIILEGGDLGDIPLRVITSEANLYSNWAKTQRSLLALSTNSSQSYIAGSTEYIESQDVENITTVIEELIASIQEAREEY